MIRAPPCQGGGRGFESLHPLNQKKHQVIDAFFAYDRFNSSTHTKPYLTRIISPTCRIFSGLILFNLHILFNEVLYLAATASSVSPLFIL